MKAYTVEYPVLEDRTRESIDFKWEALNLLMINLEEETTMRQADIFRQEKNGQSFPALPEIRLNLYLLFVANRSDYKTSMNHLSLVIRYFQSRRVFDHKNTPALPEEVEKLTVELITLPFAQQNEVWNALRTSYKPSILYKVRMVVFSQDEPLQRLPEVEDLSITTTE
ncbi:MAG: DUF4255 domain-containing protein [Lewinellaceae bacterium]|nr:DUF4255 domain-containing protein [Lewinellaceae bacterium]